MKDNFGKQEGVILAFGALFRTWHGTYGLVELPRLKTYEGRWRAVSSVPSYAKKDCPLLIKAINEEDKRLELGAIIYGDELTIVVSGTVARLCPSPNCGQDQHITLIPEGTVLKIESITDVMFPRMTVRWFEVTYQGKRGWISIFDTDKAHDEGDDFE